MKDTNRSAVLKAINQLVQDYAEFEDERHAHQLKWRIPAREAFIMAARAEGRTYEAIGDELGLSKERVRQLNASGKRRLAAWKDGKDTPAPTFRPKAAVVVHENGDAEKGRQIKELRGKVKELERELSAVRSKRRAEAASEMPVWRRAVNAERALKNTEAAGWKQQFDELYAEYMERVGALRQEIEELKARNGE